MDVKDCGFVKAKLFLSFTFVYSREVNYNEAILKYGYP